ncbi:MAG TPA: hypothetical protein EYG34_00700 [Acidimicrobiia bacterium]|jgi:phenylpropionate dioxygenase-like ring-hydroxylating dioxygenase large terminal subunit|nr:hypothetical protein [Acidimicrobiia bacterium]HIL45625.1 hypothetical protein [Acidimicrobiia bacterium]
MAGPTGSSSNDWIAVTSEDLAPGQIVESAIDGEDLVVWRTAQGTPCVMAARCPHQWSHLAGEGAVEGEEIVCLTHHWRFGPNGDGWKTSMAGRRDRKGDIEVWPCQEKNGTIWIRRKT